MGKVIAMKMQKKQPPQSTTGTTKKAKPKPKSKPKPVTLDRVTYTDGWRRERGRYAIERKRISTMLPASAFFGGRGALISGSFTTMRYSCIRWVLYDRKEKKIISGLVNRTEPNSDSFQTEGDGLRYLKTTTLDDQQLLALNRALDGAA